MNQFFLEKKGSDFLFALFMAMATTFAVANDSIPTNEFLKLCKTSDAYFLHSFTDVSYTKEWGSNKRYVSINNKMVVNNRAGVEKYAYLSLSEYVSNHIYEIGVRTLKANGSVIELDSSLVFKQKTKGKKFGAIEYPIPGVEPGDTIETTYIYTEYLKSHQMMDFVYLYSEVPSLKTEYSIQTGPELNVRYKGYNNFPEPQVVANDTLIYCVFQMEKLKGLKQNEHTCLPCELPYMYYSMENKDSEVNTWKSIYNEEFNIITQPILLDHQNAAFYGRWKRDVLGEAKDSSKYYQFKLLHKDIFDNFLVDEIDPSEILKSSGYFLKQKRFDPHSIRRMYRQLLEDLDINYWAVFARSKRAGKIDPYYIRKGEYDHIFFAYQDEDNRLSLLYPHDANYKYQIDEIPTSIYNTDAVIAKPHLDKKLRRGQKFIDRDLELAEVDSVMVSRIKLPGTNADLNQVKQILYSDVDMVKKETPLRYRFSVSGGLFTELKEFIQLLAKNEEVSEYYDAMETVEGEKDVIKIDSILDFSTKDKKPFGYNMYAEGSLQGVVTFLNDNMVSISLDKLLDHYQVDSDEDTVDLNYYLDFAFNDFGLIVFKFPKEIEVLGIEGYNAEIKNEIGEYTFTLKCVNGNELTLQSHYKILQDEIGKNQYPMLKQLNQLVKEIKNKHIVVKLRDE